VTEREMFGAERGRRSFVLMRDVLADHVGGLIARTEIRSEFARRYLLDDADVDQRRTDLRLAKNGGWHKRVSGSEFHSKSENNGSRISGVSEEGEG
jgi:hypothetical protein